jgi:hypothetical protein
LPSTSRDATRQMRSCQLRTNSSCWPGVFCGEMIIGAGGLPLTEKVREFFPSVTAMTSKSPSSNLCSRRSTSLFIAFSKSGRIVVTIRKTLPSSRIT